MSSKIAAGVLVLVLALLNWTIYKKEKHLAEGRVVYLNLAPVDPRSLMQGDYMALNFRMGQEVRSALRKKEGEQSTQMAIFPSGGYVIANLDQRDIATFKGIYADQKLTKNEIKLRYRMRHGSVKFATNAFFFQEGHGEYYERARYGQFRVDDSGELLLVAMYDEELKKLGPKDGE
ncbi:MAG: GDYXXLXY domain-containing protein [Leptospirales bacterium]